MILLDNTVTPGAAVKIEVYNALTLLGYDVCVFGEKLIGEYYIPYRPDLSADSMSLCTETIHTSEYHGLNLWDLCKGSIGYEYPKLFQSCPEDFLDQVQTMYSRATACIDICIDIFRRTKPSAVVVWGGMLLESRILSILAKENNIPVFAMEFSFDKNRIHFDVAGRIGNEFSLVTDWPQLNSNIQLTDDERKLINDWVANNYAGKVRKQPKSKLSSCVTSFVSSCEKTPLLLLAQCFIDTVITYDNPHFKNSIEAYRSIIRACIMLNQPLIVKTHPGDKTEYKKQLEELCNNHGSVLFIGDENNENVYRLMDVCSAGIVINSQSGLEMAAKGKRIFSLGNSFYGELPHCTVLARPDDIQFELSKFLTLPPLEEWELEVCRKFLYYLLFKLLIDVSKSSLDTAKQINSRLSNVPFEAKKRHPILAVSPRSEVSKFQPLRIIIVHPSPSWGGSGYYLQDLSAELVKLGHKVLILAEGTCVPYDEGVCWVQLSFQGQFLSQSVKSVVDEFRPDILVEVGVRTKPIRAALEIILAHDPLVIVQAEDDELQPFSKYYPNPNPYLMDALDKPFFFEDDAVDFFQSVNIDNFISTYSNPSAYRWVEPCLRSIMYHSADRYCAIWQPMKERLEGKFHKHCDLLPPVIRMENYDLTPISISSRKRILSLLNIPEDSIIYFVNGTIYRYSEEYNLFILSMFELQKHSSKPVALLVCGNEGASGLESKIKYFRSLGRIGDREYINLMKVSDVICAPGVPDTFNRYRLSSRLLKGMMLLKPVFTFKTGFAEILEDDKDGFFTHSDKLDEWVRVLKKTLCSISRKRVGENGFALVSKHFLASRVAKNLELQWTEALIAKKTKLLADYSGLITPNTIRSNYNKIYNTHVPIQQRVLGGVKLKFARHGIFEKYGRFSILGFGMRKTLGKIKCFHYCSGFSIPVKRDSTKIALQLKYESGFVDERSSFFIYDAEGALSIEMKRQKERLIIEFHSKYSDFLIFKPRYIKQKNDEKFFFELLDINVTAVIGENYQVDLARESIGVFESGNVAALLRKFEWIKSTAFYIPLFFSRKIRYKRVTKAYPTGLTAHFKNFRYISKIMHYKK